MASRIMHYIIASQISKEMPFDEDMFIIGNLSPDAHDGTYNGNANSHFRKQVGINEIRPNLDLLSFKEKYIEYFDDESVLGYYCHLISDHEWVKITYPNFLSINLDKESAKKQKVTLFSDYEILNRTLIDLYDVKFNKGLYKPKQFIVTEFSSERLNFLLDEVQNDFYSLKKSEELKLFDICFIQNYINATVEKVIDELRPYVYNEFSDI